MGERLQPQSDWLLRNSRRIFFGANARTVAGYSESQIKTWITRDLF